MPSCYVQIWRTGISTDTFRATEMCARKRMGWLKGLSWVLPFENSNWPSFKVWCFESHGFLRKLDLQKLLVLTAFLVRWILAMKACHSRRSDLDLLDLNKQKLKKEWLYPFLPTQPVSPSKRCVVETIIFGFPWKPFFWKTSKKLFLKKKIRKVSEDFDTTWKTSPLPYAVLLHSKKTGGKKSLHRTRSRRWCHAGLGF